MEPVKFGGAGGSVGREEATGPSVELVHVDGSEDDLLAITNFGQKSLDEVIAKLDERGLSLRTKD